MEIGSVGSSSRLLEALEKLGTSQGEGLVSSGPSPVPDGLAKAFERLLDEAADPRSDAVSADAAAPAEGRPPADMASPSDEGTMTADIPAEGHDAPQPPEVSGPLMSHTELYRLQFQIAMLKIEAESGSQVSQKTSQGIDALLRNQS